MRTGASGGPQVDHPAGHRGRRSDRGENAGFRPGFRQPGHVDRADHVLVGIEPTVGLIEVKLGPVCSDQKVLVAEKPLVSPVAVTGCLPGRADLGTLNLMVNVPAGELVTATTWLPLKSTATVSLSPNPVPVT